MPFNYIFSIKIFNYYFTEIHKLGLNKTMHISTTKVCGSSIMKIEQFKNSFCTLNIFRWHSNDMHQTVPYETWNTYKFIVSVPLPQIRMSMIVFSIQYIRVLVWIPLIIFFHSRKCSAVAFCWQIYTPVKSLW